MPNQMTNSKQPVGTNELREKIDKLFADKIATNEPYLNKGWQLAVDELEQLIADYKLPSIHATEINGIDCPACGHPTLMVMSGGYITCCLMDCPNPDYAEALADYTETKELEAIKEASIISIEGLIEVLETLTPARPEDLTPSQWHGLVEAIIAATTSAQESLAQLKEGKHD